MENRVGDKRHLNFEVKMDVILRSDDKNHPHCPHGPTFLFKKGDTKRRSHGLYYGCSAHRSRKFCQFFHRADEPITEAKHRTWKEIASQHLKSLQIDRLRERQKQLDVCTPETHLKFCRKCASLLFSNEWPQHANHGLLKDVSFHDLKELAALIPPLEQNKTNAQYFFSDECVQFVVHTLKRFEMKRILCIGTPRIFEYILHRKVELQMDCLLMDLDHRYAQFYKAEDFLLYNLFNHHFFEGSSAHHRFQDFVSSGGETAIVIDPPFGGMISVIANTLQRISNGRGQDSLLPTLLFFPYFNEDRIVKELPTLKMLDYKVNYTNHGKFKDGGRKEGSPVRIYTNLDAAKFILPTDEGYRFCSICQRYVSKENRHCPQCDACTAKDGHPYKHCLDCGLCYKSTWQHCPVCKRCALPQHPCQNKPDDDRTHNSKRCKHHDKRKRDGFKGEITCTGREDI